MFLPWRDGDDGERVPVQRGGAEPQAQLWVKPAAG